MATNMPDVLGGNSGVQALHGGIIQSISPSFRLLLGKFPHRPADSITLNRGKHQAYHPA